MRVPVHPFLVALVPVLSMYAARLGRFHIEEPAIGAATATALAAAALTVAAVAFRNARKGAILVTAVFLAVLTYDAAFSRVDGAQIAGFGFGRHRYLLLGFGAVLAGIAVWLFRTSATLLLATGLLNVVAGGALLVPLLSIGWFEARRLARPPQFLSLAAPQTSARPQPLPDIYYFIFDRYADAATLRSYGHDNSTFLRLLEERGFYIASDSRSNYLITPLSIASSLNFTFLDEVAHKNGPEARDWLPIFALIREHRLGRFLRTQGYYHVHAGSWWWPSQKDPNAGRNINYYTIPPRPVGVLLDSGLLEPIRRTIRTPWIDDRYKQWLRERRKLPDVLAVASDERPTFVFAHFLIPHSPYVFDRDGSYLPLDSANRRAWAENYVNQVVATNAFILSIVDAILRHSSIPPIVVIQSDEGPYPQRVRGDPEGAEWRTATPAEVREKTGILNAYLLPGTARTRLYREITPVNSFRLVLNEYFNADLPLLPDRTYGHESARYPYRMFDLTVFARGGER